MREESKVKMNLMKSSERRIGADFRAFLRVIQDVIRRGRQSFELRKYNRYTIAEYFRKQGAQIGENCQIIPTVLSTEPYLVKIGNHVTIARGVSFNTHDGAAWVFRQEYRDVQVYGPIIIEDNCVIGQNAILFGNIRIGPNSIVGAGSVVITDIPPHTIAMGNPARPLGSVEKYKEKCLERWNVQQPRDYTVEPDKDWWTSKHLGPNRERLRQHLLEVFHNELGTGNGRKKD